MIGTPRGRPLGCRTRCRRQLPVVIGVVSCVCRTSTGPVLGRLPRFCRSRRVGRRAGACTCRPPPLAPFIRGGGTTTCAWPWLVLRFPREGLLLLRTCWRHVPPSPIPCPLRGWGTTACATSRRSWPFGWLVGLPPSLSQNGYGMMMMVWYDRGKVGGGWWGLGGAGLRGGRTGGGRTSFSHFAKNGGVRGASWDFSGADW